jgi:hypothetical protein
LTKFRHEHRLLLLGDSKFVVNDFGDESGLVLKLAIFIIDLCKPICLLQVSSNLQRGGIQQTFRLVYMIIRYW